MSLNRRTFLRGTGALLATAGAGCGPSEPSVDELVFALASTPTNLDPRFAQDAFSDRIARLIFSTLSRKDAEGRLRPHLAESIESPDPVTFVCRLRADARFHDGSPVVADDVVATFDSIRDPKTGSVRRLALEPIASMSATDSRTVTIRLHRPHAPFARSLAGIGIAPRAALARRGVDFRDHLIGSGAFRFIEAVPDSHVLLARNDAWFGGRAGVARLRFRVVPDATVRTLEVLHGSVDLTQNDLPPHVIERLRREPALRVDDAGSTLVKYLAFNLEHPHLRDRRVRLAIAHALDREPIIRHKLRGTATPAHSFLHPRHWAHAPDVRSPRHDPEAARRLLDDAGLGRSGGAPRLRLVYRTSTDATSVAIARIFRRQLEAVGIEMELRTNEWGVFFSDIKQGLYDLFSLTAVGVDDPDWYAYVFDSRRMPPNGANRTFYSNPDVDRLIDSGRSRLDPADRAPLYRELQRITAHDLPLLPLWYRHNVVVRGRNVEGYAARPDGDFDSLTTARKTGLR